MRRLLLVALGISLVLLAGCTSIWNAGDLVDWVRDQAVSSGCDRDTIELEEWYVQVDGENVWRGTCTEADSGEEVSFAIGIDSVWTPSEVADVEEDTGSVETSAERARLQPEALKNASYSGIYDEPVPLADGSYEGNAFQDDNPPIFTVDYIDGAELYGDLDGDGVEDAAVFLMERGGGTGAFTYVAAQLNRDGQPVDAGSVLIGDRTQVKNSELEAGKVMLEVTVEGPGDAACCASHKVQKTYALEEGTLTELSDDYAVLVRISAADLDGTAWSLVELNYEEPALEEPEVTISFDDGQFGGFGGCNNFSGEFTLGEDNPFVMTIGPIASTMKACSESILDQETALLSALDSASQWGYEFGKLAIYFVDVGGAPGRLLFVPASAGE